MASVEVAVFVEEMVARCGPLAPDRIKALQFALRKLARFATTIGLELDTLCLRPEVIEHFAAGAQGTLTPPTIRTIRTNLRFVARHVVPEVAPAPVALPRERARTGYSSAEIAAFFSLADTQPTLARRHRLSGLICLGAGAGLSGAELRGVRGTDIVRRSGGVLVVVRARRPRAVPVRGVFHERLVRDAGFADGTFLVGGLLEARRNVTDRLVASAAGGGDLPRLDVGRLRATWLSEVAAAIGLRAFLDAAGVSNTGRLGELVAAISPPPEAEAVALLGAAR